MTPRASDVVRAESEPEIKAGDPKGVTQREVRDHSVPDEPYPDEKAFTEEQKKHLKDNGLL